MHIDRITFCDLLFLDLFWKYPSGTVNGSAVLKAAPVDLHVVHCHVSAHSLQQG